MISLMLLAIISGESVKERFFDKEPYLNPHALTQFFGGWKYGGVTTSEIVVEGKAEYFWGEPTVENGLVWSREFNGSGNYSSYKLIGTTPNDVHVLVVLANHGGSESLVNLMIVSTSTTLSGELDLLKAVESSSSNVQWNDLIADDRIGQPGLKNTQKIHIHGHAPLYGDNIEQIQVDGHQLTFVGTNPETNFIKKYIVDLSRFGKKSRNSKSES